MFRAILCAIVVTTSTPYVGAAESDQGWRACSGPSPELNLRPSDVAGIRAVMKHRTRFQVIRLEPPDPKENPPPNVVQVVTLTEGNCEYGWGDRFWVRKGAGGWRVLKKVGRDGWVTAD